MPDIATLRQRLSEAEAAYHRLMTGDREVEVEFTDGRRNRYSETNASSLRDYIGSLKAEILRQSSPLPASGPIGFLF
jgi:hypothetical protein